MNISEKAAYLKGLSDGLEIGNDTKEAKLINAIIDLLGDMADEFTDLNDAIADLGDEIDAISDDLEDVEEEVYGGLEDDEDDDDDFDEDEEPILYTVKCPTCNNEITVDEDVLDLGSIKCPNCDELLEFDFDEDDECGCGCGCHDDE